MVNVVFLSFPFHAMYKHDNYNKQYLLQRNTTVFIKFQYKNVNQ